MKKNILVAPSILSADFARLKDEVRKVEDCGGDMIHIDVMDGCFVPNITIGPFIVEAIKRCTPLPLDVHLMIEEPHRFIKDFAEAGADIITVHAEAYGQKSQIPNFKSQKGSSRIVDGIDGPRIKEALAQIRSFRKRAGVSLNPDSPFCIQGILGDVDMVLLMSVHPGFSGQEFIDSTLSKIKEARKIYSGDIEVDGGINDKNIKSVVDAGANVVVTGAYFFRAKDPAGAVKRLKASIKN